MASYGSESDQESKSGVAVSATLSTSLPSQHEPTELKIWTVEEFLAREETSLKSQETTDPATPKLLSKPRDVDHVSALYQMCNPRGITPIFEFSTIGEQQFSAKLTLGVPVGKTLEAGGPYGTKKEAKNAVSEKGCAEMKDLPNFVSFPVSNHVATTLSENQILSTENWVGRLWEYCTASGFPSPQYEDFAVGKQFACRITIDQPESPSFGGTEKLYVNKKMAKISAAREAVNWLIANELLDANSLQKNKKVKLSPEIAQKTEAQKSWSQQAHDLCQQLKLGMPEYRLISEPDAPVLHTGSVYFRTIKSPIGRVHRVYGKKQAKEELAKQLVEFLSEGRVLP